MLALCQSKIRPTKGEIKVFEGSRDFLRDFIHVDDVVTATLSAKEFVSSGIYNVGTGTNHSVLDLVEMIEGDHTHLPPRDGEARDTKADIGKIMLDLDWYPKQTIGDWINKYKEEHKI